MFKIAVLLVSLAAATFASPVELTLRERQTLLQADVDTKQSEPNYRLTRNVVPIHYDVLLHPYFVAEGAKEAFTFDGQVKILVKATQPNQVSIVLHANRLTVDANWKVYEEGSTDVIPHPPYEYDEVTHKLTLNINRAMRMDVNYVVELNFVGVMGDDMAGFYRSYYNDNGVKKWLGSTQFQTTSARRAFPCFDEPSFKATFTISIERPTSYSPTLSNTRIASSIVLTSTLTRDNFKTTPVMSTYLIAFIVSDYRGRQTANTEHGMYAPPPLFNQTEYSLQFADAVLRQFDNFTDYPFLSVPELEKLDQAAVPDFSAGAMENWGLMTYRETSILFHPQHSTALNKHRVAAVIAHETAHQWFGDLVTCDWWDAAWLNEGFARYFQYFGTNWIENTWELDLIYTVEQIQSAFQMDSLESTHPMTSEVNTPGQASAIFDNISYNKGSAVIRMMEHMIGSNLFKLSLQDYLKANAYSTSRPEKLWTAVQNRVPTLQIARIMDPWTTQNGYPYVTVSVDGTSVTVTQRRFLLKLTDHTDTTTWPIPLTYATKESDFANTVPQQIFYKEDGATKTFTLSAAPESYFIVNNQQTGYYRVNYDTENWMKIKDALNSANYGGIHVSNRAQIVDDLFNFARAGIVDYATALDILEYIKTETHYVPWLAAFNGLSYISRRLVSETDKELFAYHLMDILEDIYERIGFFPKEGDTQTVIYTRNNVLAWLCRYGHEDCLKNARDEFAKFTAAPTTYLVNPDHRAVVYCEGLRNGTQSDFRLLWNRFLTFNVGHEQITVLNALGCTKDPVLVRELLTAIMTDSIRYQDKGTALASALTGNPENVDVVFNFLTANYVAWAANYGFNGMGAVGSAFASVVDRFTNEDQIATLNIYLNVFASALGASPVQTIRNAINETEWQMKWTKSNAPAIREFLAEKKNSASSVKFSVVCTVLSTFILYLLQ